MNPFDQFRAPRAMAWRTQDNDLILVSHGKVGKAQEGMLLALWLQLHIERVAEQFHSRINAK